MAKTNFFKSLWFRCLCSLLAISLVASGLLAILNDVLFVSDEVRTGRAIKKVYGEEITSYEKIEVDNSFSVDGEILQIFTVGDTTSTDFDVLFQVVGNHGFHDGTITLWVKVDVISGDQTIGKVIITDNTKQTLMSKLSAYFTGDLYIDVTDADFSARDNTATNYAPVTGATYSATAVCNGLNCVVNYMNNVWGN